MTPKQKRFCLEYTVDFNAGAAYIRSGYSKKSARHNAATLLTKQNIQTEIRRQVKERENRTKISADRVVEELARIAFANITDVANWGTREVKDDVGKVVDRIAYIEFKASEVLQGKATAAISEVRVTRSTPGSIVSIKMLDKLKALNTLARHTGVFDSSPDSEGDICELYL